MRRVDDPLILPPRPRVSARRCELDTKGRSDLVQLSAALNNGGSRLTELFATTRAHFSFRRDQLANEVGLKVSAHNRSFEFFEAIDELARLGVEQRKLLLNRKSEVGSLLKCLPCNCELLGGSEFLFLAHARRLPTNRDSNRG